MSKAVAVTWRDLDAAGLRRAAARERDAAASRRMLALALVLEGASRTEAARSAGMDRQTLRDWVIRYKEEGLPGQLRPLRDRVGEVGPKRRLTQEAEVAEWVRQGPELARDGVVRWRRADLARRIAQRFGITLAERTVGTVLRRLGFRRLVTRPRHPGHDAAAQASFQRDFPALVEAVLPPEACGKPVELWWQDEARIGQQGTLTRVWAERGSRPAAPKDCLYAWAYRFGAVCPARGTGAGLVLPYPNTRAMNLHLAEISREVSAGAHAVLVLDGAGWHQTGGELRGPGNISLLHLPPYAPELNPVENLWALLRSNKLANRVFHTYDVILDACCDAWNWLMQQPDRITSIAHPHWAQVNK
ncbi:MAG TPA: IS630 family transposase [Longimicrobium sp.]